MNVACSLNIEMGWRLVAGCYCVMVPWILAHWEEYHTGEVAERGQGGALREGCCAAVPLCCIVPSAVCCVLQLRCSGICRSTRLGAQQTLAPIREHTHHAPLSRCPFAPRSPRCMHIHAHTTCTPSPAPPAAHRLPRCMRVHSPALSRAAACRCHGVWERLLRSDRGQLLGGGAAPAHMRNQASQPARQPWAASQPVSAGQPPALPLWVELRWASEQWLWLELSAGAVDRRSLLWL